MTINEFAAEVHKNAVDHGWWEGEKNVSGDRGAYSFGGIRSAGGIPRRGNRFFISPATLAAFVAKRTEARIAEAALTIRKIRTPVVPRRAKSPKGSRQSLPT